MKIELDTHTHTLASGHAYNTLLEMVAAAKKRQLKILGFTDHAPSLPGAAHPYYFHNLGIIPAFIDGIRVVKGIEGNIINHEGEIDVNDELAKNIELVIASFHPPCIGPSSRIQNTKTLITVMKNKRVNVIGHPGDKRYELDIPEIVQASKDTGTLLEINNSSLLATSFRPGGHELNTMILNECAKKNVQIIIGSDAHFSSQVGVFTEALALIKKLDFPKELILNYSAENFLKEIGL